MPRSDFLEVVNGAPNKLLLAILDQLIGLIEMKSRVDGVVIPHSSNPYLQGLSVLLTEVMSDGCDWVSPQVNFELLVIFCISYHAKPVIDTALFLLQLRNVVDGGFSCDSAALTELRNKLRAYNVLQMSLISLKEYSKPSSNCTN